MPRPAPPRPGRGTGPRCAGGSTAAEDDPAAAALSDLDLVDGLVQLSFIVQSVLGRIADSLDLSVAQVRMLAVLEDREIGMLQLARILELEKSSVTGLVDRAVRRGLVRRVTVPGNRRAVHVTVTPAGQALVRTVRGSVRSEITAMAESLAAAQRDSLRDSVITLIRQHARSRDTPPDRRAGRRHRYPLPVGRPGSITPLGRPSLQCWLQATLAVSRLDCGIWHGCPNGCSTIFADPTRRKLRGSATRRATAYEWSISSHNVTTQKRPIGFYRPSLCLSWDPNAGDSGDAGEWIP